jgi:hemoglobin/transferrin/lactoferrin receptor protein
MVFDVNFFLEKKHMKKNYFITITLLFLNTQTSLSQIIKDTITSQSIEEIKINSKKISVNKNQNSSQIEIFSKEKIEFQNFQSTADMLSNSGALFVQKSQQGGGSPVIRGFEASRILLLVDGVRMNNLIFRSGHLQNVITVDENFLEMAVVQFGPTSSLYGSDALGGSVNMITKNAKFNTGFTGNFNSRYSSVNEEKSSYFDINYGNENFASLTAFSYNDFGDLKMGKSKNHNGDFFGERTNYVETIGGVDILTQNDNKYIQVGSGFKQYNFMQKLVYTSKSGYTHNANFQYSTSSNINRYDRLTDPAGTGLKSAEWYYGPQKRLLGVYSLEKENVFTNTDFKLDAGYQNVEESRMNRNFGNYNLQNRIENVNIYSLAANFETKLKKGNLYYGMENYYDDLKSTAFKNNINTGVVVPLDTRYPNGKNNMMRNDIYVSYTSKRYVATNFSAGARIGYATLTSTIADNSIMPLPFNEIKQQNLTYSGNIGLVHNASVNFILKTNLSSGFRVPNIDDLAKIFESGAGTLIVPNKDLKPEQTVTGDFGFVLKSKSNKHQFDATYFYTQLYDAIVTDTFTYNGQNTYNFGGGDVRNVVANQNLGKAFVTGVNGNIKTTLAKNVQFNGSYNITIGRVTTDGNKRPLDHIPPFYGKLGINYTPKWATFEAYMLFNGKKQLSDYSTSGEDNLNYAPANGMPAWETYNFKAATKSIEGFTLFTGIENILDTQYRNFASGINAAGRNIYGGAKYSF